MFPVNTIIAWKINIYHEHGNMIITILLLPLGHNSNNTQYGSRQVAAVQNEEDTGAAGGSRKLRPNVRPQGQMKPKYTFDDMLNAPCKLHSTPGRSSAHTTR